MSKEQTVGERYAPAMEITDQVEADRYFDKLLEAQLEAGVPREKAEKIERSNLGYFAGYYSNETRERVERLFRCAHPVFGSIKENGPPTTRQAFEAGLQMGRDAITKLNRENGQ